MCKVKELKRINDLIKELEEQKKAITADIYETLTATGTDRLDAEDGSCFVKWVKVADKIMPAKEAYIKKGYEYLRVFWKNFWYNKIKDYWINKSSLPFG